MPFMARNYRVAAGAENTGLGGSSLGALIALYTAAVRPERDWPAASGEPVAVGVEPADDPARAVQIKRWPERVFLATGTAEAGRKDQDQSMVDDVRELAAILRRAGVGRDAS